MRAPASQATAYSAAKNSAHNPKPKDIRYEYDALNRLTAVHYSNGDVVRYSYDAAGNILAVETDAAE